MRTAVIGATGNVGSAVVRELAARGHDVVGIARRRPDVPAGGSVTWRDADVSRDDLAPLLDGADAVVHLAWMFQPTHRPEITWSANAVGTRRVLEAVARAGVGRVVVASSIAAYSPYRGDDLVDERWRTDGASAAAYAREKAYTERVLDAFEEARPDTAVVRLRPAFVFQRSAGSEQRRIFAGPLVRPWLLDSRWIPALPVPRGLRLQAVHSGDLAQAYAEAVERPVRGAFNIAADDVVDRDVLGRVLDARTVDVPPRSVRAVLDAAWRARLVRAPGDLFDALMSLPLMSSERARRELDWQPRHSAAQAVTEMLEGARAGHGSGMPPLHPDGTL